MDPETIGNLGGWIGAGIGTLCGVLGGGFGTYMSIKNTKGPRERAFMIKAAIACWILVIAFVAGMLAISGLYKLGLVPIYVVLLFAGIITCNRTQARIRQEESRQ